MFFFQHTRVGYFELKTCRAVKASFEYSTHTHTQIYIYYYITHAEYIQKHIIFWFLLFLFYTVYVSGCGARNNRLSRVIIFWCILYYFIFDDDDFRVNIIVVELQTTRRRISSRRVTIFYYKPTYVIDWLSAPVSSRRFLSFSSKSAYTLHLYAA